MYFYTQTPMQNAHYLLFNVFIRFKKMHCVWILAGLNYISECVSSRLPSNQQCYCKYKPVTAASQTFVFMPCFGILTFGSHSCTYAKMCTNLHFTISIIISVGKGTLEIE